MEPQRLAPGFIQTSAAYTVRRARTYARIERSPEVGDLVYGRVTRIGQHTELEHRSGRLHSITEGTKGLFVFGNRYAPDYFEGFVPDGPRIKFDLLARSGVIGEVAEKKVSLLDPTRIEVLGYVLDDAGQPVNTRDTPIIRPSTSAKKPSRSKLVLVVGTSMNSGKSVTAAACCWALSSMGHGVRASKVTGTASLKDIFLMQDYGASIVNDFSHFGYPSTYMLDESELLRIFNDIDLRYANNPRNYWVVELADGILQREVNILLRHDDVRTRIHRLIFAASDAFSAIGGVRILQEDYGLVPHAVSGIVSGSPLGIREMSERIDVPVLDNMGNDLGAFSKILI